MIQTITLLKRIVMKTLTFSGIRFFKVKNSLHFLFFMCAFFMGSLSVNAQYSVTAGQKTAIVSGVTDCVTGTSYKFSFTAEGSCWMTLKFYNNGSKVNTDGWSFSGAEWQSIAGWGWGDENLAACNNTPSGTWYAIFNPTAKTIAFTTTAPVCDGGGDGGDGGDGGGDDELEPCAYVPATHGGGIAFANVVTTGVNKTWNEGTPVCVFITGISGFLNVGGNDITVNGLNAKQFHYNNALLNSTPKIDGGYYIYIPANNYIDINGALLGTPNCVWSDGGDDGGGGEPEPCSDVFNYYRTDLQPNLSTSGTSFNKEAWCGFDFIVINGNDNGYVYKSVPLTAGFTYTLHIVSAPCGGAEEGYITPFYSENNGYNPQYGTQVFFRKDQADVATPYEFTVPVTGTYRVGFQKNSGNPTVDRVRLEECVSKDVWLPVELTEFTAERAGSTVALNWTTLTETNNDYFVTQRSGNGVQFESLAEILGAGTTVVPQYYNYVDENPLTGISYYRLKQTDFNGKYEYSHVVPVYFQNGANKAFEVSKTTANGITRLECKFADVTKVNHVRVHSIVGKLEFEANVAPHIAICVIELSLPVGVHLVSNVSNGEKTVVRVLVTN